MLDRCQFLASVRVLDVGGADSDGIGRLLADLGADVLKVEPPGGAAARAARPSVAGVGIAFALNNANKRAAVLDPADPDARRCFTELAGEADIVIDGGSPRGAAAFGTSCAELAERLAHLVAIEITDFGTSGPHAAWRATDSVLYAMSTALSRSGPTTGRPVLPPTASRPRPSRSRRRGPRSSPTTNGWLRQGRLHRLLPVRGRPSVPGSAVRLRRPGGGRPEAVRRAVARPPRNQQIYPTFGVPRRVRTDLCVLSARQWRGMRAWLGEPEQFADPKFESIAARYAASRELNAAIGELFGPQTMEALVAEGQRRGVPIAAVLSPADALGSEHFRSVGALTETEVASGTELIVPTGPFVVDGRHAGIESPCPAVGSGEPRWIAERSGTADQGRPVDGRPFEGCGYSTSA